MGSFGENLRREREMRGVTLEEISASTKIGVRLLQAIEAEDFSQLPGGIFTRSFIRSYAKYLGLDEEHVVAEYQFTASPNEDVSLGRLNAIKTPPAGQSSKSLSVLPSMLLAAALLFGGYLLHRYSRRSSEGPASGEPLSRVSAPSSLGRTPSATQATTSRLGITTEARGPTGPVKPGGPAVLTASAPAGQRSPRDAPAPSALSKALPGAAPGPVKASSAKDGLVLEIAATERVWIGVEADGRTAFQRILNPKDVETLKAKEFFDLTTGNAEGVVLTLNGERLKPLGRQGEVKSLHLSYNDLKNPTP